MEFQFKQRNQFKQEELGRDSRAGGPGELGTTLHRQLTALPAHRASLTEQVRVPPERREAANTNVMKVFANIYSPSRK